MTLVYESYISANPKVEKANRDGHMRAFPRIVFTLMVDDTQLDKSALTPSATNNSKFEYSSSMYARFRFWEDASRSTGCGYARVIVLQLRARRIRLAVRRWLDLVYSRGKLFRDGGFSRCFSSEPLKEKLHNMANTQANFKTLLGARRSDLVIYLDKRLKFQGTNG